MASALDTHAFCIIAQALTKYFDKTALLYNPCSDQLKGTLSTLISNGQNQQFN